MLAPVVGHHRRHAVDRAIDLVDPRQVELADRALGIREQLVRVADQHGVDARHGGEPPAAVLHRRRVRRVVQPAVRDGDHHVGALRAHLWDVLLRGLLDADGVDLAVEPALVPAGDGRRREADDADLERRADGAAVRRGRRHGLGQEGVGLEQRRAGLGAHHVGQHLRKTRPRAPGLLRRIGHAGHVEGVAGDLRQVRQAVVELVIADAAAVVPGCVHHLVDGQGLAAGDGVHQGLVVGQRGALDGVAVVEQQRVGKLRARLRDQRRHALEAERAVGGQLEVVVRQHVGVQVGGLQHGERCLGAAGRGGGGARIVAAAAGGQRQRQPGGQRQCRRRQRSDLHGLLPECFFCVRMARHAGAIVCATRGNGGLGLSANEYRKAA